MPSPDLVSIFAAMQSYTASELDLIASKRQEEGEEGLEYAEVFTDFATKDFVERNIRVRPISGIPDETKDGRQSNVSRGKGEGDEDEDDKFNKLAALEMQAIRQQQKEVQRKIREDAAKKAAALEAAKKKKAEWILLY